MDSGISLLSVVLPNHNIENQYVIHQSNELRPDDGILDIGAYEFLNIEPSPIQITTSSIPDGTKEASYSEGLQTLSGVNPYSWSIVQSALLIPV